MVKVIITRYGGLGDIHMLEPSLRAIYKRHAPCEITFRTYPDYREAWEHHPLISNIILDDMSYRYGYEPDGYDYHYNFQGISEGIFGRFKEDYMKYHRVYVFAREFGLEIDNILPNIYFKKVPTNTKPILIHLGSAEADRDLNGQLNIDGAEYITTKLSNDEYCSKIQDCKVLIGTDSSALHIAAGLRKKHVIGIYKNMDFIKIREYPGFISLVQSQIKEVPKLINYYPPFSFITPPY